MHFVGCGSGSGRCSEVGSIAVQVSEGGSDKIKKQI